MMEFSKTLSHAAHRLGLELRWCDQSLQVSRRGWTVEMKPSSNLANTDDPRQHHLASWALFGLRLGLDKRIDDSQQRPATPLRFRRTQVRRYHEAPSVHGDHYPLLVPRAARQLFEAIAGEEAFYRRWLQPDLEVLVVHETGRRLDILTRREQTEADLDDQARWEKVRSALFYQSYKIRPRQIVDVAGGSLRLFETTEGFGASRALLLPEYDYDAAREYGYLAIPSRDQIIIARPAERDQAPNLLEPLGDLVDECLAGSKFGLTDALFGLTPDGVEIAEAPTVELTLPEDDPASMIAKLIEP